MKGSPQIALLLTLALAIPAFGQEHRAPQGGHEGEHNGPPHGNGGRIPPPLQARGGGHGEREVERDEHGHVNNRPHVNNDHWYGHDVPNDARFHLSRPFEHGRFQHFEVAAWDWAECSDWCWNCGEDLVVYEDPDHIGRYLLCNTETGVYVHVTYLGG